MGITFLTLASIASAAPSVYGESAMVKVRPGAQARADTGVGLTAAKNEFVSFQVVVQGGDSGAKNVKASFGGLTSSSGNKIAGTDLTLYREEFLNTSTATFPDSAIGAWPDALVPDVDELAQEHRGAFPFNVAAKQARAIWADIHVPSDLAGGVYQGAVTVSGDGFSQQVHVTVTVLNLALPSTPSLTTAFLLFAGNVCKAHTGDTECHGDYAKRDALIKKYVSMGLEHRLTLSNVFFFPSNGNWAQYDSSWGSFLDGSAPTRLPGAKVTSVQFTGPRDVASYAAFAGHLKSKGWFDRAFDYTGDEPPYGISYGELAQRASIVHQGAPDLPTLATTTVKNATDNGVLNSIDIMVPVINFLDGTAAPYVGDQRDGYGNFLSQSGHKLWTYQSCMSQGCAYGSTLPENNGAGGWPTYAVDAAASRNRAMEWVSFLERVQGELYYETAGMLPDAWHNQYNYNSNGDGNLFYPGTPSVIGGTSDVPVASIRMKMIRMGVQDFEWLKRVRDAGDPAFADAVARAVVPSSSKVSNDGYAYDRARLELASRYLELTHQSPAPAGQGSPPSASAKNPAQVVQNGVDPVTTPNSSVLVATGEGGDGGTGNASIPLGSSGAAGAAGSAAKGGCSAASPSSFAVPGALVLAAMMLVRSRRPRTAARVRAQGSR